MCMSAAALSSGHIIYPIGSLYLKRQISSRLRYGKIAPAVGNLAERCHFYIFNSCHHCGESNSEFIDNSCNLTGIINRCAYR